MVSWHLMLKEVLMNKDDSLCLGEAMGRNLGETSVWNPELLKYLPISKYPLQVCHCFTEGAAPPEAVWPGELSTGQPQHAVIALTGLTTVRNMGQREILFPWTIPAKELTRDKCWLASQRHCTADTEAKHRQGPKPYISMSSLYAFYSLRV